MHGWYTPPHTHLLLLDMPLHICASNWLSFAWGTRRQGPHRPQRMLLFFTYCFAHTLTIAFARLGQGSQNGPMTNRLHKMAMPKPEPEPQIRSDKLRLYLVPQFLHLKLRSWTNPKISIMLLKA